MPARERPIDQVRAQVRLKRDQARAECDDIRDAQDADWLAGRISALNEALTLLDQISDGPA